MSNAARDNDLAGRPDVHARLGVRTTTSAPARRTVQPFQVMPSSEFSPAEQCLSRQGALDRLRVMTHGSFAIG